MTWQQALALAAAMGVTVVSAAADTSLPPVRYDIGGGTEAEALANYSFIFGNYSPPVIRVRYGDAYATCNRINMERFSTPYPEGNDGWNVLVGCMIRNIDKSDPVIVYSYDPDRPEFAAQIFRHEVGHLWGWTGDHPR